MVKDVVQDSLVIAHKDNVVIVYEFMDFNHNMDFIASPDEEDTPLVLRRRVTNM